MDKPSRWTRRLHLIFLALGALALGWLIHQVGVDAVIASLTMVGWGFLLGISAHFTAIVMDSFTLRAAMGAGAASISYWHVLRASLAGHAINEATPLSKLGEITKFSLLAERVPGKRAAAALIVQNIIMFVANCALMVTAPLVSIMVFNLGGDFAMLLCITSGLFAVFGMVTVLFMIRGPGEVPFRLAARLGLGQKRVERWRTAWKDVEAYWHEATSSRRTMAIAWTTGLASRVASVTEISAILFFLGSDNVIALACLSTAGTQMVMWLTSFIPMQAGTAEGGAYLLYTQLGLSPVLGVSVELIRRLRRVVFIGIGVSLLGWQTFREFTQREPAPDVTPGATPEPGDA